MCRFFLTLLFATLPCGNLYPPCRYFLAPQKREEGESVDAFASRVQDMIAKQVGWLVGVFLISTNSCTSSNRTTTSSTPSEVELPASSALPAAFVC
jgi:hypothetical protein